MHISASDAQKFLTAHLPDASVRIKSADANDNGNLTRAEAKSLGADFADTYDLYKERGKTVRTDDFLDFYKTHARVSANSGQLSGDLVGNFQIWRSSATTTMTDSERANIVWDKMGPWGPTDSGPRYVNNSMLPPNVQSWIDAAKAEVVASDDRLHDIWEMYEVPVGPNDARVAGYAILGYGENDTSSIAYQSLHIYSPEGKLLDFEIDSTSI